MISFDDFLKVDMRVGTVIDAKAHPKAKKPAYILTIDFGEEIGLKGSSAQLCDHYSPEDLIGRQIVAVINFPPIKVASFKSEVLVLAAVCAQNKTILLDLNKNVMNGTKIS